MSFPGASSGAWSCPMGGAVYTPTLAGSNPGADKVLIVEMYHTRADFANLGDNVDLNIKGFDFCYLPADKPDDFMLTCDRHLAAPLGILASSVRVTLA